MQACDAGEPTKSAAAIAYPVLRTNIIARQIEDERLSAKTGELLNRRLMDRSRGRHPEHHPPQLHSATVGWSLRSIIATPHGLNTAPQRGVVVLALSAEVSCPTGTFTALRSPVRPVAWPDVTVECSPKTTNATSSARLSVIAGGTVFTAERP